MDKDDSLFTSFNEDEERKIYVTDVFSLKIICYGDVPCRNGIIFDIYHVPNLSANLLSFAELT
jgi:hypothetical protein